MIIADSSPCSYMTSRFNDLLVSMEKLLKRFPCLGWFGWLYFEFLLALFSFLPIGYCDYLGLLYQDTQSKSAHLCSLPKLSLCDQHPILDPSLWMIQMCTLYPGETEISAELATKVTNLGDFCQKLAARKLSSMLLKISLVS